MSVVLVLFQILIVGQSSVQVRNKLPEGSICPQRWHRGHVFVLAQWFFFSSSPWCRLSCDCRLGQCMWEDLLCLPPPGASCQIGQHHEGNWFPPWQTPRHSITEAPHQLVRNSDAQQQKSYYKSQIPALFNWSFKACRSLTPSAYHLIILLPTHYNICISTVTSHIQPSCSFPNLHLRLCDC